MPKDHLSYSGATLKWGDSCSSWLSEALLGLSCVQTRASSPLPSAGPSVDRGRAAGYVQCLTGPSLVETLLFPRQNKEQGSGQAKRPRE